MKQVVKFNAFLTCTTLFKSPAATGYLHLAWLFHIRYMRFLGQDVELAVWYPYYFTASEYLDLTLQ